MRRLNRRAERRTEATERQLVREELGDAGQLLKLESAGYGECKEAKRLRARLEKKGKT